MPVSPLRASSSNMGYPNGSRPDLEGIGYRASTIEEKINEIFEQIAKLPPLMQSISRFENSVQTLSHTVARMMRKSRISNQWLAALQPVLPHSSGSGSARSWNMLGQSTGSTATESLESHEPRVI